MVNAAELTPESINSSADTAGINRTAIMTAKSKNRLIIINHLIKTTLFSYENRIR